jgi:TonB family protein
LSDCRKIDKLLWVYPNISIAERDELERHLSECPRCRAAFETIKALGDSARHDEQILSGIDTAAFDAEVMRRIRRQKSFSKAPQKAPDRYVLRMAFSYALAAIVVLFLARSLSDLGNLTPVSTTAQNGENKNYDVLNLHLRQPVELPSPQPENAPKMASKDLQKSSSKEISKVDSAPKILAEAPVNPPAPAVKADTVPVLSMRGGREAPPSEMSALAESVNIGDIALAGAKNQSPDMTTQYRAASRPEFYALPGSVQVAPTQSSVLVTIEKMPKAVKMVIPEYPVWAQKQSLSGTVWIRARVESDGNIKDAEIKSCDAPGLGFEEASLKAARESVFIPASANGINLAVWIEYPVRFICKK